MKMQEIHTLLELEIMPKWVERSWNCSGKTKILRPEFSWDLKNRISEYLGVRRRTPLRAWFMFFIIELTLICLNHGSNMPLLNLVGLVTVSAATAWLFASMPLMDGNRTLVTFQADFEKLCMIFGDHHQVIKIKCKDDAKAAATNIMVKRARVIKEVEKASGTLSKEADQARIDFKLVHTALNRFDLVNPAWDGYFEAAQREVTA